MIARFSPNDSFNFVIVDTDLVLDREMVWHDARPSAHTNFRNAFIISSDLENGGEKHR